MDVATKLDEAEHRYGREAKKAGTAFAGTRENFYEGFDTYRKTLRHQTTTGKVEDLLNELRSKHSELPWE